MRYRRILSMLLSFSVILSLTCITGYAKSIPEKDETVYAVSNEEGEIEKTTVSEKLKINKEGKVDDVSSLCNIENVKGDETFSKTEEHIVWNAEGKDIYYQGESYKSLPVEIKVKYYLNGIRRDPEKMAGKSGSVKIVIDFDAKDDIPYLAVSALSFPQDSFSNVTVSSGEVVTNGEKIYIAGTALPGLEKITSKLNKKIGGSIVIKAECSSFKVSDIYTVLTNEEIKGLNIEDGTWELKKKVDELTDASKQIEEGAKELKDGAGLLNSEYEEMDEAVKKISKSTENLDDGIDKLVDGSESIYTGMTTLQKNLELTYEGVENLTELTDMLSSLDIDGLSSGVKEMYNGLGEVQKSISAMREVTDNESSLLESQQQQILKLKEIKEEYEKQGVSTESLDEAIKALESVQTGLETVNAGEMQYEEGVYDALSEEGDIREGLSNMQEKLGELKLSMPENAGGITVLKDALQAEYLGAKKLAGYQNELTKGLKTLSDGASKLSKGTGKLSEGSSKVKEGIGNLKDGAENLSDGITEFNEEGIGQIESTFTSLESTLDDFNNSIEKANEYESYGGNLSGQEVKTKFVIRTKGISDKED